MNFSIKKLVLPLAVTALLFSACDKAETAEQLGDSGAKMIKFVSYGGTEGDNFASNSNLAFDPTSPEEQLEVQLELSAPHVLSNDVTITLGVDQAKLDAYNATVSNPANRYQLLPATAYELPTTPVVIKAGQTLSEPFFITFHPDQIDGSINFMLPVTIKTITGAPADFVVAPGTGTAYFHFIGNPISGFYNMTGIRYNFTGGVSWSGPPAAIPAGVTGTTNYNAVVFAAAIDGRTVSIPMGNIPDPVTGALATYFVSGTDATFSNISYDFASTFNAGYSNIQKYVVSYTPPTPTQKASFHLVTKYNNSTGGAGSDRIVDQTFVHQ